MTQTPTRDPDQKSKIRTHRPRKYAVIVFNDDYTHWDFVLAVLQRVFGKTLQEAEAIVDESHSRGCCLVDVYPLDIAETRVAQALHVSRTAEQPLRFDLLPESGEE